MSEYNVFRVNTEYILGQKSNGPADKKCNNFLIPESNFTNFISDLSATNASKSFKIIYQFLLEKRNKDSFSVKRLFSKTFKISFDTISLIRWCNPLAYRAPMHY